MTAQLSPVEIRKFFDNNGLPLAFGTLTTYQAGTTTPQATYVDSTQTTANTNPITLNFRGECALWLNPVLNYKFLLKDLFGNTIPGYPVDNIPGGFASQGVVAGGNVLPGITNLYTLGTPADSFANAYLGPNGVPVFDALTGNIGYYARTAAEITASVTPTDYFYAPGTVDRYGTNTTPGTTDMSAAFTAANAVWAAGGPGLTLLAAQTYLVSSVLTIAAPITPMPGAILKTNLITLNGAMNAPPGQQIFLVPTTGAIAYTATPTAGTLYTTGTYPAVPLTGGTGSGAQATIVVAGGGVTSVTTTALGIGYTIGDSLSASAANIGGTGSGFAVLVQSVAQIMGSLGGVDLYTRWYGDVPDGVQNTGFGTDNQPFFSHAIGTANLRATSFTTAPNMIRTLPGIYKVGSKVQVGDNINWLGGGKFATTLFCVAAFADTTGLIAFNGKSSYPSSFRGFLVGGQVGGSGGSGIVSTKNATFFSDIWVSAFNAHPGVVLSSTDNFISEFAIELCLYGLQITASDVTVSNGTTFECSAGGVIIDNTGGVGNTDAGRVTIENVRDSGSTQNGFLVTGGQHVSLTSCHAVGFVNTEYNVAAFEIQSSTDVVLTGCTGTMVTGASTAPGILIATGCTDVMVNGCRMAGFYDGLQANAASFLNVTGGQYVGNSRNGVLLSGGTCQVTGVNARGNASAGIDSENTTAAGMHVITGCQLLNNNTFGLVANLTGAGSKSNVQGNQSAANSSGQYSFGGAGVASITVGSALAAGAGVVASVGTNA